MCTGESAIKPTEKNPQKIQKFGGGSDAFGGKNYLNNIFLKGTEVFVHLLYLGLACYRDIQRSPFSSALCGPPCS